MEPTSPNKDTLANLACPACKQPVALRMEKNVLVCAGCHNRYKIVNGIPIMLVSEALRAEDDDTSAESGRSLAGRK